jgi:hypothetical protein
LIVTRIRVEPREVEQLLDELAQPPDLGRQRLLELRHLLRPQHGRPLGDRLRDPVDGPDR